MTFSNPGAGHMGFCSYFPPGDYPYLYAVVFENPMSISNTCEGRTEGEKP